MPESFDSGPTLPRRICDDARGQDDVGQQKQKETANFGKLAVRRGLILRLGGPQKYRIQRNTTHPTLGSSFTDHSAWSFQSLSVTVITSLAPSIVTCPKNCMSELGDRFWPCSLLGALMYLSCGPNVLSSSFGPNVPACAGPDTNSQNGSKSWNCALFGSE